MDYTTGEVKIHLLQGDQLIVVGSELWIDDHYYTIRGKPLKWLHPPVDWRRQIENIRKTPELADTLSAKEVDNGDDHHS